MMGKAIGLVVGNSELIIVIIRCVDSSDNMLGNHYSISYLFIVNRYLEDAKSLWKQNISESS
jgi:hypothetical protein